MVTDSLCCSLYGHNRTHVINSSCTWVAHELCPLGKYYYVVQLTVSIPVCILQIDCPPVVVIMKDRLIRTVLLLCNALGRVFPSVCPSVCLNGPIAVRCIVSDCLDGQDDPFMTRLSLARLWFFLSNISPVLRYIWTVWSHANCPGINKTTLKMFQSGLILGEVLRFYWLFIGFLQLDFILKTNYGNQT